MAFTGAKTESICYVSGGPDAQVFDISVEATPTPYTGEILVHAICAGTAGGVYLTDGSPNYTSIMNPVTGNDISGATVILSNETTGISTVGAYTSYPAYSAHSMYAGVFQHLAHENVSVKIQKDAQTIIGATTMTPTAEYSNLTPTGDTTVQLPFKISWEVTSGTDAPTHTLVYLRHKDPITDEAKNYQELIPFSQTSFEVTSAKLQPGEYMILLRAVRTMSFTGAKSGSLGYVWNGIAAQSFAVSVEAGP